MHRPLLDSAHSRIDRSMTRGSLRAALCALGILLVAPGLARADGAIRWDRVMGSSPGSMDAKDKARAEGLMRKITVYYGCSDTVAACLRSDPDCQTARRLAGLIVRAVKAGRSDAWILEEVKHRGVSMHPFKTHRFNLTARPRFGAPADKAKVTVVEFADFECPFCRVLSPKLKEVVSALASRGVSLVFKHYPVSIHKQAPGAARAAYAVHQQGKFWPYHDLLYKKAPRLSESDLEAYARSTGVEVGAFRAARDAERSRLLVAADKREGLKAGVQGTPTLYINGKHYRGRKDATEFRDRLEEELHLVGGGR